MKRYRYIIIVMMLLFMAARESRGQALCQSQDTLTLHVDWIMDPNTPCMTWGKVSDTKYYYMPAYNIKLFFETKEPVPIGDEEFNRWRETSPLQMGWEQEFALPGGIYLNVLQRYKAVYLKYNNRFIYKERAIAEVINSYVEVSYDTVSPIFIYYDHNAKPHRDQYWRYYWESIPFPDNLPEHMYYIIEAIRNDPTTDRINFMPSYIFGMKISEPRHTITEKEYKRYKISSLESLRKRIKIAQPYHYSTSLSFYYPMVYLIERGRNGALSMVKVSNLEWHLRDHPREVIKAPKGHPRYTPEIYD